MKIIDLLNKITNDEKLPKKIKYEKHIYEYQEGSYDWGYYNNGNGTIKFLLTELFESVDNTLSILNYEVEILEEEKKIPEKLDIDEEEKGKYIIWNNEFEQCTTLEMKIIKRQDYIIRKINEIIDCLNYLKSKGE